MGDWTPISVAESTRQQPSLAHSLGTIGGDNGTPFPIFFPDMPPALQWVFPFTYGFLYPLPSTLPKQQPFRIWSDQTPPGTPAAGSSGLVASLSAFEDQLPYSAGIRLQQSVSARATQPGGTRWTAISDPVTNLPIGTYTIDIPGIQDPVSEALNGNLKAFAASIDAGIYNAAGAAVLWCSTDRDGGGGSTTTFTLQDFDPSTGASVDLISAALAAQSKAVLRVAPGLPAAATTANDLVSGTPRVKIVVATAAVLKVAFTLDLLPL